MKRIIFTCSIMLFVNMACDKSFFAESVKRIGQSYLVNYQETPYLFLFSMRIPLQNIVGRRSCQDIKYYTCSNPFNSFIALICAACPEAFVCSIIGVPSGLYFFSLCIMGKNCLKELLR